MLYYLIAQVNKLFFEINEVTKMSQHPSLRIGGKIRKVRNVMKRYERIDVLRADGRITEEKYFGLPKTKTVEA